MQHPNPDHARHDANLIAGHAAGDLSEVERPRAEALLAACEACSDLRRDLVAIAATTRSVPAPASLARDLRLSPEQAARLRRGSWLRAFLRPFGAAGSPFRPMAAAFTSLGVVGLVVGMTLNAGLVGGAGTGFSEDRDAHALAASAAPAAEGNGVGSDTYAPMVQSSGEAAGLAATSGPRQEATDGKAGNRASATALEVDAAGGLRASQAAGNLEDDALDPSGRAVASQPANPVIAGSLALLGIGLLLFGLRIASRRVG